MGLTNDDKRFIRGLLDEKFDARLEPINSRLDKIEQTMATKSDLKGIRADIKSLKDRTAEGFQKTETHLRNLADQIKTNRKEIQKLQKPKLSSSGNTEAE